MPTWNVQVSRAVLAPMLLLGGLLFVMTTGVASWVGHYQTASVHAVLTGAPGVPVPWVAKAYAMAEPRLEWTLPAVSPILALLILVRRETSFRTMMIYFGGAFSLSTLWCGWTLITALIMHTVIAHIPQG